MCDLVQDVETIFHFFLPLTVSVNLFFSIYILKQCNTYMSYSCSHDKACCEVCASYRSANMSVQSDLHILVTAYVIYLPGKLVNISKCLIASSRILRICKIDIEQAAQRATIAHLTASH